MTLYCHNVDHNRCPIPWCDPCGTDHSPDWSSPRWSGWPFSARKALGRHWRTEFCICVRGRPPLSSILRFGVFGHTYWWCHVCVHKKQTEKNHHARLETYCIMVLVAVESRIYFRGNGREAKMVTSRVSFQDTLIREILSVSISSTS